MPHTTLVIVLSLTVCGESKVKPFSAAVYKRLILEQRSKIKSMYGSYTTETVPDTVAEKSDLMRSMGKTSKIRFAWSGDKRFLEDSSVWLGRNLKPNSESSVTVFTGKDCRRRESNRLFRIQPAKSAYSELNPYLSGSLKWPMTAQELAQCKAAPAKSNFLPFFLDADDWKVRPQSEIVDGVACVVLEQTQGGRKLWLDPRRGYCMLRLVHDRPSNSRMLWINHYSDFREVIPEVFFPFKAVGENTDRNEQGISLGTITTTLTVRELRCNSVPDELFVLEPSNGDIVTDKEKGIVYQYLPRDDKTLETAVELAEISLSHIARSGRFSVWLCFFTAFLVVVALSVALRRTAFRRKAD